VDDCATRMRGVTMNPTLEQRARETVELVTGQIEDVEHYSPTIPLPYQQYHRHIRSLFEVITALQSAVEAGEETIEAIKEVLPFDCASKHPGVTGVSLVDDIRDLVKMVSDLELCDEANGIVVKDITAERDKLKEQLNAMQRERDEPRIGKGTDTVSLLQKQLATARAEIAALNEQLRYVTEQLSCVDCGAAPVEELARRAAKQITALTASVEELRREKQNQAEELIAKAEYVKDCHHDPALVISGPAGMLCCECWALDHWLTLERISKLDTSQLATPQQCEAVLIAMDAIKEGPPKEIATLRTQLTAANERVEQVEAGAKAVIEEAEKRLADATKRAEEAERAETELKSQLRLCEEHAGSMAKDFDASIAAVQSARDQALARAAELEQDKARLDELEKAGPEWWVRFNGGTVANTLLRQAIDAALAARKTDTKEGK
jgi:chromosome segregation ATPase